MKNLIETMRKEHGVKQDTLANAVGVSRQTIVSIERGKCTPSVAIALRISRFFNTPVEEIFIGEDTHFWTREPHENKNYQHNTALGFPEELIYGQSVCADLTYGSFPLSFNGGEIIAVYNALRLNHIGLPLADIILEFEENRLAMLDGFAGTDPKKLGLFLAAHDIKYRTVTSERELKEQLALPGKHTFLYSYFDLKCPLELRGLHTVAGVAEETGLRMFNMNNADCTPVEYRTFAQLKKGRRLIIAYILE